MTSQVAQATPSVVPDYLDYFGLHDDPFSSDLQPFYDGGNRRELFAEVLHLCQFSASISVVLGEEGVGKGSLKMALVQQFDDQDKICSIDVPVLSSSEWLLDIIAVQLAIDAIDSKDTGQAIAIVREVIQSSEDDNLKVLMVENAHNLDAEALRVLIRLAAPGEQSPYKQLHLVLFATPDFEKRLPAGDQALVQIFHLLPIAPNEMKHYLRFRLDAAGFSGIFPFKDTDIQFLWDISKGIPAKFHGAAREILIELALPPQENKTMGLPVTHMVAVVLLLAGLLAVFFYQNTDTDQELAEGQPASAVPEPTPVPQPETAGLQESQPTAPLAQQITQQNTTGAASVSGSPSASIKTPETKAANVDQQTNNQPKQTATSTPPQTVQTKPAATTRPQTPVPNLAQVSKPAVPKPDNSPAVSKDDDIEALLAAAEEELAQEPIKPPQTTQSAPIATADLTADESRLLNRSPTNYTLQILASGSKEAVNAFMQRQPNRSDMSVFTANRNGKTLYIVVLGSYASSDAASLAVSKLPEEQRSAGPWPRSFQSVQADIREFRGF